MFNTRTKLTHRFIGDGGLAMGVTLWNPDSTSIAEFMDCGVEDVEWFEDDDGDEWCIVKGEKIGKLEVF